MAANYVLLERVTVGAAGAASVTFNNIPQTGYTDLKIMFSTRGTQSALYDGTFLYFNGSNTSVTGKVLTGSGAAAGSASPSTALGYFDGSGATATANTFGSGEVYIPNYTSSNYKSVSADTTSENNGTNAYSALSAGLWSSTAAITSITFKPASGTNFSQYSTFSLYGLAAVGTTPVIAPYASGGDIIQTDGTYWYHAFLSTGSFTPAKALSCDVLVVAGGGGGGYWNAGGGGAGGLLGYTAQTLANGTSYTATIGAGGTGSNTDGVKGTNGINSQFASLTASVGGGGGASNSNTTGSSGGSGGGGAPVSGSGGSGTSGQGNAGGTAMGATAPYIGGGGGGAGQTGNTGGQGYGGNGVSTYSSWGLITGTGDNRSGTVYYAGGGSAAGNGGAGLGIPGGYGGGGQGATSTGGSGYAGTANTGGGGGASSNPGGTGGNGGAGIVIIRYAI